MCYRFYFRANTVFGSILLSLCLILCYLKRQAICFTLCLAYISAAMAKADGLQNPRNHYSKLHSPRAYPALYLSQEASGMLAKTCYTYVYTQSQSVEAACLTASWEDGR